MPNDHCESQGGCACGCSSGLTTAYRAIAQAGLSRRSILAGLGATAVAGWAASAPNANAQQAEAPAQPAFASSRKLVVQPVLTYAAPQPRPETSWRSWGGIMTDAEADQEIQRITAETKQLAEAFAGQVEFTPAVKVKSEEQANNAARTACDVTLVYAAGGWHKLIDIVNRPDRPTLIFLRHRSGPVSLHYEVLHPWFLRHATDQYVDNKGIDVKDVVVDSIDDLKWRLRALLALRKTLGQRIIAIGGSGGWGEGGKLAPAIAKDVWHLDIRDEPYSDLEKRIKSAQNDPKRVEAARQLAHKYLADKTVKLETKREYVDNAFLLYDVFKELLTEHDATAMTIQGCMTTVIPISKTTACLPLGILNDDGYLAFCESDFVVIPSGLLMHHIVGTPAFLNDPTWPHHGIVTLAHCTAPRRMNGTDLDPVRIMTHFESDYGAAPKVDMRAGEVVTMVIPDFASRKWVGASGRVECSPFHAICRSQIDVAIDGNWEQLLEDMRGFHWMLTYGDCRREVGYAIKHLGIGWQDVSA